MVEKFVIGVAALVGLLASQHAALHRQNERPQQRSETRPTTRQIRDVAPLGHTSGRSERERLSRQRHLASESDNANRLANSTDSVGR